VKHETEPPVPFREPDELEGVELPPIARAVTWTLVWSGCIAFASGVFIAYLIASL